MNFDITNGGPTDSAVPGVAPAIVTDNKDPKERGRVKLEYPWRDAADESDWARVVTPMAGKDRGTYFLPDIGDEVAVAFQHHDIHHPIVLGSLWNGQDGPPEANEDKKNNVKKIRSRRGHEITLNDSESQGKIELETNAGQKIILDDSTGGERIEISDKSGQDRITFDANAGEITIKGGAKVGVEATMLDLRGTGNVNIEAAGMLTLKGSIVKIN